MYQHEDEDSSSDELSIEEEEDDIFPPTLGEIKDSYPTRSQLATAAEYERRIHTLEQINATLRENISALYAEANSMSERHEPVKPRRATHMEISQDEAYETSIVPYEDPSVTEKQCMHQIEKLEKTNASLRWKLARQKLLVSQLSANLKDASEKIEDLQSGATSTAIVTYDHNSANNSGTGINGDRIQVVQHELQSILQLISTNTTKHKAEISTLLEDDKAMHSASTKEETVSDKVQRVIMQLRGEQSPQSADGENKQVTFASSPVQSPTKTEEREDIEAIVPESQSVSDASDASSMDSWHKDPDKVGRNSILETSLHFVKTDAQPDSYDDEFDADSLDDLEEIDENSAATENFNDEKEQSAYDESEATMSVSFNAWKEKRESDKKSIIDAIMHARNEDTTNRVSVHSESEEDIDESEGNNIQGLRPSVVESIQSEYSVSDNRLQTLNEDTTFNEYLGADESDASSVDSWRNDRGKQSTMDAPKLDNTEHQIIKSPAAIVASTPRELERDISDFSEHVQNRKSSWGIDVEDQSQSKSVASNESSSVESWHGPNPRKSDKIEVMCPQPQDQSEIEADADQNSIQQGIDEDAEEIGQSDNLDLSADLNTRCSTVKEDNECISREEPSTHIRDVKDGEPRESVEANHESPKREISNMFDYSISDLIPTKAHLPEEVTDDRLFQESTHTNTTMDIEELESANHNKSRPEVHGPNMNSLSVNSLKVWDEYAIRTRKTMVKSSKAQASQLNEQSSDPLSARLSRRQIFQQRNDVAPLENIERRQHRVLVRASNGIDFVPPALPPSLPSSNQDASIFRKGAPDGFYQYKSSSGNEFVGYWKDGKRHGFGTAKVS